MARQCKPEVRVEQIDLWRRGMIVFFSAKDLMGKVNIFGEVQSQTGRVISKTVYSDARFETVYPG